MTRPELHQRFQAVTNCIRLSVPIEEGFIHLLAEELKLLQSSEEDELRFNASLDRLLSEREAKLPAGSTNQETSKVDIT